MTDKRESKDAYSEMSLLEAVEYMRGLQKAYFKTRDRDTMKRAIEAEKTVDKLVEDMK